MIQSLSNQDLARYVNLQLSTFFPDGASSSEELILSLSERVNERLEHCFNGLVNRYFSQDGEARFDHLHSEQYGMYLYLLGNEAWRSSPEGAKLATKTYLLNKALHGFDAYYEITLPPIFWLAHPLGTVLGRADYGNYFAVMQGCTVGNKSGFYPKFGERVLLSSHSSVIGDCRIGNDVCIGAGALLIDIDVPDGSTVVGRGSDVRILAKRANVLDAIFRATP
jgi:serine O-acetyltransferase